MREEACTPPLQANDKECLYTMERISTSSSDKEQAKETEERPSLIDQDADENDCNDSVDSAVQTTAQDEQQAYSVTLWMNRVASWLRGSHSSAGVVNSGQRVLLECGSSNDVFYNVAESSSTFCSGGPEERALVIDEASQRILLEQDLATFSKCMAVLLKHSNDFALQEENVPAAALLQTRYTPIPHVRQLEAWDCGVACLQMTWQWLLQQDSAINTTDTSNICPAPVTTTVDREWMLGRLNTESVWTVDLVILLDHWIRSQQQQQQHSVPAIASFLFLSKTLGVDETLSDIGYYRAAFLEDQRRVQTLFDDIKRKCLPVLQVQHHLPLEQVVRAIQDNACIAIVLVDNYILLQGTSIIMGAAAAAAAAASNNIVSGTSHFSNATAATDTYAGHYIILQGISCEQEHLDLAGCSGDADYGYCLVVANPGTNTATTYVAPDLFERAWRATGTDDDCILVAKHGSDAGNESRLC